MQKYETVDCNLQNYVFVCNATHKLISCLFKTMDVL